MFLTLWTVLMMHSLLYIGIAIGHGNWRITFLIVPRMMYPKYIINLDAIMWGGIIKSTIIKGFFDYFLEAKTKLLKNLGVINHLTCLGFRSIKFLVSKKATLACNHCDTKRVIVLYWMYHKTSTTIISIVNPISVVWKEENGFFSKFSFKSLAVWNRQKRPQWVKNRGVDSFVIFNLYFFLNWQ